MPSQNFQRTITRVRTVNIYEVLPVLGTRREQKRGAFLRESIGTVTEELRGEMCWGGDQRKTLKKGSSFGEKSWRF